MRKMILSGLVLMLLTSGSNSQTTAHTETGRKVLLYSNGTWKYAPDSTAQKAVRTKLPAKRKFLHPEFQNDIDADYYFKREYDQFEDKTRTAVGVKIRDGLYLRFYYYSDGINLEIPKTLMIMFASLAGEWQFEHGSNLSLLLDGEKIDVGQLHRIARTTTLGFREFLYKEISIDLFLKILNSDHAAGKLRDIPFVLKKQHLEAFRDFGSRMK